MQKFPANNLVASAADFKLMHRRSSVEVGR